MNKSGNRIGFRGWREWATAQALGRVLEIGAGSGLNYSYYDRGVRLTAFDPDLDKLVTSRRGDGTRGSISLTCASALDIPFPSGSFDAAVATLVMCTIPDPERALSEIARVVKPGGSLRLVEHVRSRNRILGPVMDAATPLWKSIAGGCHLNRDTLAAVRAADFEILGVDSRYGGLLIGIDARRRAEV